MLNSINPSVQGTILEKRPKGVTDGSITEDEIDESMNRLLNNRGGKGTIPQLSVSQCSQLRTGKS